MRSITMLPAIMLGLFGGAAAAAEPAIKPVTADFAFDGAVGEWVALEPALTLGQKQPDARGGRVWLGQSPEGLIVAGAVDGPPPRFAAGPAQMPGGDHVELWLAIVGEAAMPPVGWSPEFGPQELKSAADCVRNESIGTDRKAVADCRAWYAAQLRYRARLARLFARQWQLAPGIAVETWAKPAFEAMSSEEREAVPPLSPGAAAQAAFAPGGDSGYTFEIRVPWQAMPPANDPALGRLRLMVDVFSPDRGGKYGPFSSTSEARQYARLDTLGGVSLDPPRRFRLARCGYPLEADDFWYEKRLAAYYMPGATEEVDEMFVLENPVTPYQYQPADASPSVTRHPLFSRALAPDVVVCGPKLAVQRGDKTRFNPEAAVRADFRSAKVDGGLAPRQRTRDRIVEPVRHWPVRSLPDDQARGSVHPGSGRGALVGLCRVLAG